LAKVDAYSFFVDRDFRGKIIGYLRNRTNRLHGHSANLDALGPWPSSPGACAPDLPRPSAWGRDTGSRRCAGCGIGGRHVTIDQMLGALVTVVENSPPNGQIQIVDVAGIRRAGRWWSGIQIQRRQDCV